VEVLKTGLWNGGNGAAYKKWEEKAGTLRKFMTFWVFFAAWDAEPA
jgi:hypothetical protein